MARLITFKAGNSTFEAGIVKVDRSKVYGWIEPVYTDNQNNICSTASLLDDGRTIVVSGGLAQKLVDTKNQEVDKSSLIASRLDGSVAELKLSVYEEPVNLKECSMNDLFDLDVTAVYQLEFDADDSKDKALECFSQNQVYTFDFNYRTDYESADAIILKKETDYFILTGIKHEFEYLSNEVSAQFMVPEETIDEDLDFGMM